MRIAYISYEYPPDSANGGIATYIGQVSRVMADRGHEVEVFASSPSRDEMVNNNGVIEHWVRESNRIDFGIVAGHRFAKRHGEKPFDVLEGPDYSADARKAVELVPDVPLVVRMHTPNMMIARMNRPAVFRASPRQIANSAKVFIKDILRNDCPHAFHFAPPYLQGLIEADTIEKLHARAADVVAPPCHSLGEYASNFWGIHQDRIRVTPYPYIAQDQYLELKPRKEGKVVGFVGRLERRKGIEALARAIPRVLELIPDARFRLIGASNARVASNEPYDLWLKGTLSAYLDRVEFIGKIPLGQMANAYDCLNICVYPSLWENFPNVCLEAMSAARAVIGSSAGGMTEMLDQGACGRLVAPEDDKALAAHIVELLKNPEEQARLGLLARRKVLSAYNRDTVGSLMETLYGDAIASRGKNLHRQQP